PPAAIAPFDADQAKAHQKAWAGYLGVPVEKEVELPGGEKMKFILIPPGEFMMGTTEEAKVRLLDRVNLIQYGLTRSTFRKLIPYETPSHRVRITRPFYLGRYEVTQAQWQSMAGSNPSESVIDAAHPVEMVSWIRVQSVIANLNVDVDTGGDKFALPTEAQWEFACRAGTTTFWHFGDDEFLNSEYGWFESNTGGKTRAVGLKRPNAFGLHDMHGNVREWCLDGFLEDYYAKSKLNDPLVPEGVYRVQRGGSSLAHFLGARSATRLSSVAKAQISRNGGFRLAITIDPKN
ncbi:MAG: formylglycine-generating enzyme family protein, partial [Planctomycetota bacterium]|nr:formylglycine-generating enzyme family protein [Planctomycetota bacterium]